MVARSVCCRDGPSRACHCPGCYGLSWSHRPRPASPSAPTRAAASSSAKRQAVESGADRTDRRSAVPRDPEVACVSACRGKKQSGRVGRLELSNGHTASNRRHGEWPDLDPMLAGEVERFTASDQHP